MDICSQSAGNVHLPRRRAQVVRVAVGATQSQSRLDLQAAMLGQIVALAHNPVFAAAGVYEC